MEPQYMLFKLKDEFNSKYNEILLINDDLSKTEYNKVFDEIHYTVIELSIYGKT